MPARTWLVDETNRTPQARRHKQNVIRIQINKATEHTVEESSCSAPPTHSNTSTHDPLGHRN
ncbi:GM14688 [Drosophila sechellia]|uniref:GM14688 n=1 Tax=Drosophila sechellia TaxID=7238 RepID=B4HUC3_DROSE|nr:GM14688 [Drosophila sechellia]